jgi:formate dehydrogenase subunit gamma
MQYPPWEDDAAVTIIQALSSREGALLPILHAIKDTFGHVPASAVPLIAAALNLSRADVHGVITFYKDFRREPPAAHVLKLCRAEACQARGGERLALQAGAEVIGQADICLELVYCLGLCASGPAAMIDGRVVGRLTPARLDALLAEVKT